MENNLEKTILEAIYGFCCNDIKGLTSIKSFVSREFINGGLVHAEDKAVLSSVIDEIIIGLRKNRHLELVFFDGDEPCFETTKKFSELLGYTFEGEGI